jgi:hypothetical protein
VSRVTKLLEANKLIPGLMEANKELTELAETFRRIADQAAKAIYICEKTVMTFDNGTEVWDKFNKRLEEAWPKTTNLGTEDQQATLNQENIIQSGIENKHSTEAILSGETTAPGSLQ